jgi:hypothetical protein
VHAAVRFNAFQRGKALAYEDAFSMASARGMDEHHHSKKHKKKARKEKHSHS